MDLTTSDCIVAPNHRIFERSPCCRIATWHHHRQAGALLHPALDFFAAFGGAGERQVGFPCVSLSDCLSFELPLPVPLPFL